MSYLQDKKVKRKKILSFSFLIIVLFFLFYFRAGIFKNFSYASHKIFHPVFLLGNSIEGKLGSMKSFFATKNSLFQENQNLKSQLSDEQAQMANYNSLLAENASLKETLGRKNEQTPMILAAILAKPNQSPYDTLIVDAGINEGIKAGNTVFAFGSVPVGRIAEVYPDSSKVILFSNTSEKTQVILSSQDVFMEAVGRGGGNFEMIMPRDLTLMKGDQVVLPGTTPYVLAIVETILSDPRDPFIKALLVSPVNIQELRFVEVQTQK